MIESVEKEIGKNKFICTQFPARKGLKIQFKLFKLLGPLFTSFSAMEDPNFDAEKVSRAIASSINEDQFFNFVMELLQDTKMNGQDINAQSFDMAFAGDYKSLYELIFFVIETNYGNFFSKDSGIMSQINNLVK